ncbi:hypothetical protein KPNIH7_04697 [Klebsiella pneumoniae subsp. pneumoniae KPNIH7]|nr:hypothetical protein KPNIH7_04697 [Klebsiella pneumoniae subsp. pneumoniae KPNIH7]
MKWRMAMAIFQEKQTIQFLIKIKVIFFLLIFSMLIFVIEY